MPAARSMPRSAMLPNHPHWDLLMLSDRDMSPARLLSTTWRCARRHELARFADYPTPTGADGPQTRPHHCRGTAPDWRTTRPRPGPMVPNLDPTTAGVPRPTGGYELISGMYPGSLLHISCHCWSHSIRADMQVTPVNDAVISRMCELARVDQWPSLM